MSSTFSTEFLPCPLARIRKGHMEEIIGGEVGANSAVDFVDSQDRLSPNFLHHWQYVAISTTSASCSTYACFQDGRGARNCEKQNEITVVLPQGRCFVERRRFLSFAREYRYFHCLIEPRVCLRPFGATYIPGHLFLRI